VLAICNAAQWKALGSAELEPKRGRRLAGELLAAADGVDAAVRRL
jgi:hypothetical protein